MPPAKQGGIATLDELRKKIRENLDAAKEQQQNGPGAREDSEQLVKQHDFPVPEALIEARWIRGWSAWCGRSQRRESIRAR